MSWLKNCAHHGFDLLVAADARQIKSATDEFRKRGVTVEAIEVDLATVEGNDRFLSATHSRLFSWPMGHGFGRGFLDQEFEKVPHVIDTNIKATIYLVQKVGRDMNWIWPRILKS
jgi:short-subunit dehydrogenase